MRPSTILPPPSRTDETQPKKLVHLERVERALAGIPSPDSRDRMGLLAVWSVWAAAAVVMAALGWWLS